MSHISHSNIRIDNFQFMRNDLTQYCFFLSHCHEDHIMGLNSSWNYGKIYASQMSKALICDRFPHLKAHVIGLEMNEEHWIFLDEEKKEGVSVVLLDACHCPGAVMFLIKGKMGTVLHTGDFRFHSSMLQNKLLCPEGRRNLDERGITVDIDYLHLDNTFANPEYDFPSREEGYKILKGIVNDHKDYRVFVFSYTLGKEEVFLNLADDFQSFIVVDEDRMRKIKTMNLRPEVFTTDPSKGWIHVKNVQSLKTLDIEECNEEEPTIFIILTGWNDKYNRNLPFYFKVPYSSHSNFREIERFVKACQPKNLIFNVDDRAITKSRLDF